MESFGTLKGKLTFRMVPRALLTLWVIQISRLRLRSPAQWFLPYPSSHALQLTYAYVCQIYTACNMLNGEGISGGAVLAGTLLEHSGTF